MCISLGTATLAALAVRLTSSSLFVSPTELPILGFEISCVEGCPCLVPSLGPILFSPSFLLEASEVRKFQEEQSRRSREQEAHGKLNQSNNFRIVNSLYFIFSILALYLFITFSFISSHLSIPFHSLSLSLTHRNRN